MLFYKQTKLINVCTFDENEWSYKTKNTSSFFISNHTNESIFIKSYSWLMSMTLHNPLFDPVWGWNKNNV